MNRPEPDFVSRAGHKLAAALADLRVDPAGRCCADLGSNAGGFVDCLLQRGAARVYAVERGYGVLDYRLRRDPRVVVLERANALTVRLPELVELVTIDVGWTRQRLILPAARRLLAPGGTILTLVKPHYEADPASLDRGVMRKELLPALLAALKGELPALGFELLGESASPLPGRGGNREFAWHLAARPGGMRRNSESPA